MRWTSLGLSLLEAMHAGMPVVALATTEATRAIPPEAGLVSNDLAELNRFARHLLQRPEVASDMGKAAREAALERYSLAKFLDAWDELLAELSPARPPSGMAFAGHGTERIHR
jgi:glycosyltransferase involved in cell wall biosynthesis